MQRATTFALFVATLAALGAEVKPFKWSGDINVPDPTACTVDEAGNVYVASTTRRKAGDLDIREHSAWTTDDVALTSPEEKLAFYQRMLAPGVMKQARGGLKDHNKDGSIDWKDLTFHKERIYKLSDTDRDGVADKITVFAEGFNSPISGIAAGVLYFDGWVYLTAIPDVWRLKDTDGDGVADLKELVTTGFGVHIAYAGHDMHGLRLGPDGRIYWSIGDKGLNVTSKEGKRFSYPHQGAVVRCEPDGTNFEVFAHGVRNIQEIAFDNLGNVIGVDNDADQPKERERLTYLLEGSDSGWRNQHQYQKIESRWMKENIWMPKGQPDQPLSIMPPIANYSDGPAGFLYEPGQAIDGEQRGHFFLNQFPKGKMDAFTLEPDQDSFRQTNLRTISAGIMGIGMAWGVDGKAYLADWIGGYPLDGKGAIWRFDVAPNVDKSSEGILSKPFSVAIPKDELLSLLSHRDQRVRVNASIRLHRLSAWDDLLTLAKKTDAPRFARIHAIWGYGMGLRLGKILDIAPCFSLLDDTDGEIRVQALKVLSEARSTDALVTKAIEQLAHDDLRVRTQAGITLGKLGGKMDAGAFWRDAEADLRRPWLRHGLVSGLAGTQTSAELLTLALRESGAKAAFATLALARQHSPLLGKLLDHPNPDVVNEAARGIHDDEGVLDAQEVLAQAFLKPTLPMQAARRALNANLRQGDAASLERLVNWTLQQPDATPFRAEALKALLFFDRPPVLDFVDGTAKTYPPRDTAAIRQSLQRRQDEFLAIVHPSERTAVLELMVKYELNLPFPVLLALAEDLKAPPGVRLQTLRLLGRKTTDHEAVLRTLRAAAGEGNPSSVRIEAINQIFTRDAGVALEVARAVIDSKAAKTPEKQAVVMALRDRTDAASAKLLRELVERLNARKLDAGLKLDVFLLAKESNSIELAQNLQKYLATGPKGRLKMAAPEIPYELLTEGGDALKGKAVINGHLGANCIGCHRVDSDEGSEVGPMLRTVGALRTKDEIVESLVEPSAKIVTGYGIETIVLKDGTVLAGSVIKEGAKSLDLRLPDGKVQKIAVAAITSRTPPVSVMPPMLGILTPSEIRDVVAYLSGLKPKATKAKPEKSKK